MSPHILDKSLFCQAKCGVKGVSRAGANAEKIDSARLTDYFVHKENALPVMPKVRPSPRNGWTDR